MLRFNLGKIPVHVHSSHLMIALLIGFLWAGPAVRMPLTGQLAIVPDDTPQPLLIALWMAIVFISVLVHELGHAGAAAALGHSPSIHLAGMGGHTIHGMPSDEAWYKRFAVILAGPVAGGVLGLAAGVAATVIDAPALITYVFIGFATANFLWAIFNLLPVAPLDGSQLVHTVAMRAFGKRGFVVSNGIALVAGVLLGVWALSSGQIFVLLIAGMGSFEAFKSLAAYFRGELDTGANAGALQELTSAQEALTSGDMAKAESHAKAVLASESTPPLQARAHYLLGWIALRRKEGRVALDHFAQAGKTTVEPEALASAFTLIGDDHRAAALWELAYRERKTAAAGQAWVASLLLQGHDAEAARIPSVDHATAELLAARTAFERKDYTQAAALAVRSVERSPSNEAAYDAACAYAQLGNASSAVQMLDKARALGFSDAQHAANDPDLAPLRGHPDFERWLSTGPESRPH